MQKKKDSAMIFSVALLAVSFIYGLALPFMWGNNPALPTGTLSLLCEDRKIYFWIWGILMSGSIVMSSQLVFKKYNVKNRLLDVLGVLSFISILGVALTLGHSIEDWNPKRLIHWIMTGVFIAFTFLSIALFYIMQILYENFFIITLSPTLILKFTGSDGIKGMCSAIAIGSIICIVSAIAGDTSQDLKTGYLLGSTPKKQQTAEIIGVVASALAIGGTLYLLDKAWGFGSDELAAPQATLMKLIVEGVMGGNLPWGLVAIGVCIAVVVELIGIPVLPFAIGVYLPVQLNACIMVGGVIRLIAEKLKKNEEEKKKIVGDGILFCSGMIAGEGLIGILLAILAIFGVDKFIDLGARFGISNTVMSIGGIVLFAVIILTVLKFTVWKKRAKNEE